MPYDEAHILAVFAVSAIVTGAGCQNKALNKSIMLVRPDVPCTRHALYLKQELVNDAPIGPGVPQPSHHCPTSPGTWIAGSGRAAATSNVFGDLKEVEVYCINSDRAELSGGMATWTDSEGDTISMSFGAKLLRGFVYSPAPSAPLIGFAQVTGDTGKWAGITGDALLTGHQNGNGSATLVYRGTVYLPK